MRAYGCVVVSVNSHLKPIDKFLSLLYGPGLTDMFFHHNGKSLVRRAFKLPHNKACLLSVVRSVSWS